MAKIVYVLCTLTSFSCAFLLLRSYAATRYRLLWWSGLCFVGLTLNNLILIVDAQAGPQIDLTFWRLLAALVALLPLLYGLIWEEK